MPDEVLYPVKLATEQAQLILTPSSLGKAELYAKLADRRVAEIVYLAKKGDAEPIELAIQRLDVSLTEIAALARATGEEAGVFQAPAPSGQAKVTGVAPAPRKELQGKDKEARRAQRSCCYPAGRHTPNTEIDRRYRPDTAQLSAG